MTTINAEQGLGELAMSFPSLTEIQKSFSKLFNSEKPSYFAEKFDRVEAERICEISEPEDISQSEDQYFECAQKLRELGDYPHARAILNSLKSRTQNPVMKAKAWDSLIESQGEWRPRIEHINHEWSDEDDAGAVRDLILFQGIQVFTLLGPVVSYILTSRLAKSAEPWESPTYYDHSFDHLPPYLEAELQELSEIIEEGQLDIFNPQLSLKEYEKFPDETCRLFLTLQLIGILSESREEEWKTLYPFALQLGVVNEKNEMRPGPYRDFAVEQWEKLHPGQLPPLSFEP